MSLELVLDFIFEQAKQSIILEVKCVNSGVKSIISYPPWITFPISTVFEKALKMSHFHFSKNFRNTSVLSTKTFWLIFNHCDLWKYKIDIFWWFSNAVFIKSWLQFAEFAIWFTLNPLICFLIFIGKMNGFWIVSDL